MVRVSRGTLKKIFFKANQCFLSSWKWARITRHKIDNQKSKLSLLAQFQAWWIAKSSEEDGNYYQQSREQVIAAKIIIKVASLAKTIFYDSIKHICEECKEGSPKCPKVRSTLENWSLTRVPNPWEKYVDSKHCWAVFWNRHKYLSVLYPNIYSLHQQASKIERTRGCKNLWRWNVERIMAIKEHLSQQWCIDILLAIIYIPYLSFLKAKWNGKGIGSVEKSVSIKAICL